MNNFLYHVFFETPRMLVFAVSALVIILFSTTEVYSFDTEGCKNSAEQETVDRVRVIEKLICELKDDRDNYYRLYSRWLQNSYIFSSVFVILASAIVSTSIALGVTDMRLGRTTLAIISAAVAITVSIMTHFDLYGQWKLRELGRIKTQALIDEAESVSPADVKDAKLIALAIREKRTKISENQALEYFNLLSVGSTEISKDKIDRLAPPD